MRGRILEYQQDLMKTELWKISMLPGLEVFATVAMKFTVFCDIARTFLTWTDVLPSHLLARSFLTLMILDPENGSDSFLRNAGSYKEYTKQYPLR
jgi:hypothetical protein